MRKIIAKGMPQLIQNHSKSMPWATSGRIFEIFVDLGRIDFLMFFRLAKRRAKIEKINNEVSGESQSVSSAPLSQ
jgi:hypothetical protein